MQLLSEEESSSALLKLSNYKEKFSQNGPNLQNRKFEKTLLSIFALVIFLKLLSWSNGHDFCLLRTTVASNFLFNTLSLNSQLTVPSCSTHPCVRHIENLHWVPQKLSTNHIFKSNNKKGYLILLSSTFFKYSSLFNTPNIVSLSCSNKNDKLMISKCFVMILQQPLYQWQLCPTNPSNDLFAQVQRHVCVWYKIRTVSRYFEKCFFKLTGWQDCIAFASSYTRNRGFSFVSSLGMAVILLIIVWPWVLASAHCKPSDCIHHSCRISFLNNCSLEPENHWVYLYQITWKSKQTWVSDFEIIIRV